MTGPILSMRGISKQYPGVQALKDVDVDVHEGEVHALVGANGAGKSTLVKIISGGIPTYEGQITFAGADVAITSPLDSERLGIATVYQEVDTVLVPTLSVAENLFLSFSGPKLIRWRDIYQSAEVLMNKVGWNGNVRTYVKNLSLAEKQLTVIARALGKQAKVIIFDEPTASLGTAEAAKLQKIILSLRDNGISILYISHRLNEVFHLADRVTVMRDGQKVFTSNVEGIVRKELHDCVVQGMLSKSLDNYYPKEQVEFGDVILTAHKLSSSAMQDIFKGIVLVVALVFSYTQSKTQNVT